MTALIIIGIILAYIAIGCLTVYILVRVGMVDPYDDEGTVSGMVCAWPLLIPLGAICYGISKFTLFLQDVYDRRDKKL